MDITEKLVSVLLFWNCD